MTHSTNTSLSHMPPDEMRRRKRERVLIVIIMVIVGLLALGLNRRIFLATDFSVSNQVLIFIMININLLLLLLLIFLVFRNLVKLFYDRRHKVMGVKLRTRLVVAFITLTLAFFSPDKRSGNTQLKFKRLQRVFHQHGDRHRTDTTGNRGD